MVAHNPWIESTHAAYHARVSRVHPQDRLVTQSGLLANQHLSECEAIVLVSEE